MATRKMTAGMVMVVLFLMSGAAQADTAARRSDVRASSMTKEKMVLEYAFSEPVVSQKAGYDVVQIEGLESYQRVGAPIVPVRPVYVLVPSGKEVKATNITLLETHELPGVYKLMPGQRSYPYSYEGPIEFTEPDPAIYDSSAPWPGKNFQEVGTQSKRGYQVFIVNLFPVQYRPLEGKVSYATQIRLEITLDVSEKKPVLRPSRRVKAKLKADVDNPYALKTYGIGQAEDKDKGTGMESGGGMMTMGWSPGEANSLLNDPNCPYYGENWNYVVITSLNFADSNNIPDANYSFQALCDSKEARGISAGVVDTNWIYANYDPCEYDPLNYDPCDPTSNNATSIRMFLMDAYQTWGTEFALLGGAIEIIPARMLWTDTYGGPTDDMPADMYYGCVEPSECTFNYNGDWKWGEPTDGVNGYEVDMWAEIYVGRAAVEDANEVVNFVRKTLAYDSTDITSEYLRRAAMVGEYMDWGGVADYAKDILEQIRLGGPYDSYFTYGFENSGYSGFFVTEGCMPDDPNTYWPMYDKDSNWPRSDLIDLMNGGVHIFNHLGHGNTQCMAKNKAFCVDYIKSELQNTDYFFGYSQSCDAGKFDDPNCFAEEVTTMEYGAFAAVMNARYGAGTENSTDGASQRFNRQFWDAVLGEDMLELGRANQDSKEDNYWDIYGENIRWCYYQLNLFGDPELRFHMYPVYNATQDLYYETIQGAINDANNGDEIIVAPGTYYEAIDFNGVSCTLRSATDVVAATVIDANGSTQAVDVDANATISGFTLTGGTYGVYCDSASPTISRCIIEDNSSAGVYCNGGSPEIENNKICDNSSYGINCSSSDPNIKNNWIYHNGDAGIRTSESNPLVRNNTIAYNTSKGIWRHGQGSPTISNCIIWANNDDLFVCSATYSCIEDGDSGTGNISSEPCFVDSDANDYHIEADSPCIDAGAPNGTYAGEMDIDFSARVFDGDNDYEDVVDIGADEIYGPISHWKFDEGSGTMTYDSAVGKNSGTVYGVQWTSGKIDGALEFAGEGNYVDLGLPSNLSDLPLKDMTISAWIYDAYDACSTWGTIAGCYKYNAGWSFRTFSDSNGERSLHFQAPHSTTWAEYRTSDGTILPNIWHHVAMLWDSSTKTAKLYIDGYEPTYQTTTAGAGTYKSDTSNNKEIGRIPHSGGGQYFKGTIDDLRVYDRILSSMEIEYLSHRPFAYWKFNETSGTTADECIGSNDGTLNGDTSWVSGMIDGAVDFDADGDYVSVGSPADLDNLPLDDFTISAWIYDEYTSGTTWGTVMGCYAYNAGWSLRTFSDANGDRSLHFGAPHSAGDYSKWAEYWSSDGTITSNTWHHVAAVWDANIKTAKLYIDGEEPSYQQSDPGVGPYNSDASRNKEIGRIPHVDGVHYFNGRIDDVRIYKRALSDKTIRKLYRDEAIKAFGPNPIKGATEVHPNTVLSWWPGKHAAMHDVYFGTDYNSVNDATTASAEYMGQQDANSFDPNGRLDLDTTYYWRIDEVNDPSLWKGYVWNFTSTVNDPNLVSWWKLDEGSGTTAADSASNNSGTLNGNPVWTTGQIDGALSFDGDGDCVDMGDKSSLEPSSFTISAWIKPADVSSLQQIAGKYGGSIIGNCGHGYRLEVRDGKASLLIDPTGCGNTNPLTSTTSLQTGQWYFVAGTYDGTTAKIYVDGKPENNGSRTLNWYYTVFYIGISYSDYHIAFQDDFNGVIDDVRIYDQALPSEWIEKLYQDGL